MIEMTLNDAIELVDSVVTIHDNYEGAILFIDGYPFKNAYNTNSIHCLIEYADERHVDILASDTIVQVELRDYDAEIAKLIEAKAKLDNWLKMKGLAE